MAGSKKSNDLSPLEKWRQAKDKVLDAEDVDPSSATKPATAASGNGDLTYIPIQARSKGEATMLPGQAPNSKGEATMLPGQAGKSKGEATMLPGQAGKSKGEATMLPGQAGESKDEATMLPGQAGESKDEATMLPGQSRTSGASEPKIIRSGTLRRRGAGGKMMPGSFRPSKSQATMLRTTGTRPKLSADARAIASTTIKTFIKELRSIATRQGMDFSTEQPDNTTVDFLTRSKMLRVSFTGREINIDRIVLMDNGRLRVAPVRSGKSGVFDWDDSHPPEDLTKVAPNNLIAIEAHFVNTGENRDCRIELVNRPSAETGAGGNLTPDGARRLVMLLLDSLSTSAGT